MMRYTDEVSDHVTYIDMTELWLGGNDGAVQMDC